MKKPKHLSTVNSLLEQLQIIKDAGGGNIPVLDENGECYVHLELMDDVFFVESASDYDFDLETDADIESVKAKIEKLKKLKH